MKIYNSLTRSLEDFVPIDSSNIRMYVCGPTVYDRAHLGNARPSVIFDVVARIIRYKFKNITYVRNITDVDDKITNRSKELGVTIKELTTETYNNFINDMNHLNVIRPDIEPKATDHISQMIALISRLVENKHAYVANNHVLFDVMSNKHHGELSGNTLAGLQAGARIEIAPYKKDPADFVLWKPSDDNTPGWNSPWGYGRPGWHIECSAMSHTHLGENFDIHGGGHDLIFPHHENELAQSRCAYPGSIFAKYWMHNGMLLINGQKMSKSLNNFMTVKDILDYGIWAGEAFRFMLLKTHYRQDFNYTHAGLLSAKNDLDNIYDIIDRVDLDKISSVDNSTVDYVIEPLLNDINTPLALSRITDLVTKIRNNNFKIELVSSLLFINSVLGIAQLSSNTWFRTVDQSKLKVIQQLLNERIVARNLKDWKKSDKIRQQLKSMNISIQDQKNGETSWRS